MRNNYIDPEELEQLDTAQQCSKCRKVKFRSRHQGLCSTTCHYQPQQEVSQVSGDPNQVRKEEIPDSKEEKRAEKMKKREERREERERRRMKKNKKKVPELGLLGSLLREVIKANTWT